MLLQTNSYVVPKQHRAEHARLLARFRKALARVGCDLFEVYEQADANWDPCGDGRFVQIMRFRNREHQQAVRAAERMDLEAQSLIEEFCRLINFPYQQEHGLFAVGFYTGLEPEAPCIAEESDSPVIADQSDELGAPAEEELDDLLHAQFTPAASSSKLLAAVGDPDLARVLDAGLALDDLDIPMEAELLDEPESEEDQQPVSARKNSQQPDH